ncbi:MAG TPA: flagellar assembly protein FliH [Noviherbaspirillum sp.]|uniref:flagellar assembly protein FliH n=1 Tax=Noviherbaspirillum sp. TaxID=1926288 RepID=UPI002B4A5542|nr:flagellar assembly protein FliH [Noviherbaspirillum sp.]HJV88501.1 flagellar assembly protein FliH [Noviherbaspirillum sp.]
MSSNAIPKEQLSAYQRWELASFGDDRPSAMQNTQANAKLVAEQLAKQREEARLQGYEEGFAQGQAAGLASGQAEAARELTALRQLADNFAAEVSRASENVADDMLNLSLDVAKAMLKTALKIRPELVLAIVGEAIRYLPSLQQPALLVLHPQDAEIVRSHMADELGKAGWRIAEDIQMERGGCRVETASNQIEATPAIRWQRITDALGKQSDWLE